MWSVAPRVRRSGLRGKEVRWAPTTAMSMVAMVVWSLLLLAMVVWVDVFGDVSEWWMELFGDNRGVFGLNVRHIIGFSKI